MSTQNNNKGHRQRLRYKFLKSGLEGFHDYEIIDVRDKNEFDNLHVQGAKNYPLFDIINNTSKFKKNKKYVIHCLTGYRSSIASSLLKQYDIKNIINVNDGFKVISKLLLKRNISFLVKTFFVFPLSFTKVFDSSQTG